MSYMLSSLILPSLVFFLAPWSPAPLLFNLWFSGLTGLLILFLLTESENKSAVSVLVVEESLALGIMACWLILGGSEMILILLIIKSALAPFHVWLVEAFTRCSKEVLAWSISFHKLPVVLLLFNFSLKFGIIILFFSFALGAFFLLGQSAVRSMFVLSSGNVFSTMMLIFCLGTGEGFIFLTGYCLTIWGSIICGKSFNSMFLFFGLTGVPPLFLFQMKWSLLLSFFMESVLVSLSFIFFSAISVIAYIRFCFLMDSESGLSEGTVFLGSLGGASILPLSI